MISIIFQLLDAGEPIYTFYRLGISCLGKRPVVIYNFDSMHAKALNVVACAQWIKGTFNLYMGY